MNQEITVERLAAVIAEEELSIDMVEAMYEEEEGLFEEEPQLREAVYLQAERYGRTVRDVLEGICA